MTAPTLRETADHIGEANEKVLDHIGDATTMIDHAELAALIQDLRDSRTVWDNARARPKEIETRAADALENLLSEIAALRGERDRWHSAYEIAHDQATANGSSARQAERQRDEAVGLLRMVRYPSGLVDRIAKFLANQGADQ